MVKSLGLVLVLGMVTMAVGCDDTGTGGGTAGNGGGTTSSSSSGGGGEAGAGGAGGAGGSSSGPPQAPMLTSVAPQQGGLHIEWMNVTPDCDKIELDRNKDGSAFALAYTVIGVATSQHDGSAVAPGMYCYKARCLKGAEKSADSAEKCGTP